MAEEIIDLTTLKPSEAFQKFNPTDIVLIVGTGAVGYLVKEAFKYFFPEQPSVVEQLRVLATLIEAAGKAGAKSLKVRISANANWTMTMPQFVKGTKVLHEDGSTVDLEIVFV